MLLGVDISCQDFYVSIYENGSFRDPVSFPLNQLHQPFSVQQFSSLEDVELVDDTSTIIINSLHTDEPVLPFSTHNIHSTLAVSIDGVPLSLPAIFPLFVALCKMKRRLNHHGKVSAVVSHSASLSDPHYSGASLLLLAFQAAGIEVHSIIPASVSVAIRFFEREAPKDGTFLACNLGYSFTDIVAFNAVGTQCKFIQNSFSVTNEFSGQAIDQELYQLVLDHIQTEDPFGFEKLTTDAVTRRLLLEKCQEFRLKFCRERSRRVRLLFDLFDCIADVSPLVIKYSEFEPLLIKHVFFFAFTIIQRAIELYRCTTIILTGGISRIEQVRSTLMERFPEVNVRNFDFKSSVYQGAALYCSYLNSSVNNLNFSNIIEADLTSQHPLSTSMNFFHAVNDYLENRARSISSVQRLAGHFAAEREEFAEELTQYMMTQPFAQLNPCVVWKNLTNNFLETLNLSGLPYLDLSHFRKIIHHSKLIMSAEERSSMSYPHQLDRLFNEFESMADIFQLLSALDSYTVLGETQQFAIVAIELIAEKFGLTEFSNRINNFNIIDLAIARFKKYMGLIQNFDFQFPVYFYLSKALLAKRDLYQLQILIRNFKNLSNAESHTSSRFILLKMVEMLTVLFKIDIFTYSSLFDTIKTPTDNLNDFSIENAIHYSFSTRNRLASYHLLTHFGPNVQCSNNPVLNFSNDFLSCFKNDVMRLFLFHIQTEHSFDSIHHYIHYGIFLEEVVEADLLFLTFFLLLHKPSAPCYNLAMNFLTINKNIGFKQVSKSKILRCLDGLLPTVSKELVPLRSELPKQEARRQRSGGASALSIMKQLFLGR
ncbi:hypothetical protein P9112_008670 [Eukaryota sp. TZLM1-RC]